MREPDDQSAELTRLEELEHKPALARSLGYLRLMGPGYMQSAMTLGGGTAFASIFAGAAFGYQLLWVAPLSMLLGIILLSAVAHQTLSTNENPFQAMKKHAGAFFAYGWAIAAILSSIIWQFAQYGLAAAMLAMLAHRVGIEASTTAAGAVALIWCVGVGLLYNRTPRLTRLYESILKWMVWFIIACFAFVVVKAGVPHPGDLARGLIPSIPAANKGVSSVTVIVGGLAAAVGVNMLFVYPYTLRKKGWAKPHRRLARFDLGFGMFLPFAIAASLMLIASASVYYYGDPDAFVGKKISPVDAAKVLSGEGQLGTSIGTWVFGLGVIAMALSSITMQMLASGFAFSEMFGWKERSWKHAAGTLLPAIGVLGAIYWGDMVMWVAVPTSVISGTLMPIACVGFIILHMNKRYLGPETPRGVRAKLWIVGLIVYTLVLTVGTGFTVWREGPRFIRALTGSAKTEPAVVLPADGDVQQGTPDPEEGGV
jgi:manganese transport protein